MADSRTLGPEAERQESLKAIRPLTLEEFVGQDGIKERLRIYIQAAKERGEPLDHVLLLSPPGLGKTTLAYLIARELGVNLFATSGPALETPSDLVGILTKLGRRDVLFIDEVHRLHPKLEEYLYAAMEDYVVDLIIDKGPNARTVRLALQPFTLVGATTREGLLSDPFRARFGVLEKLMPYPPEVLARIVERSAQKLAVKIEKKASFLLAARSRGTPRIANRFLRRIRDMAQMAGIEMINEEFVKEGLRRLGVDEDGLDPTDRRILSLVAAQGGRPVGLKTIAVALGEEERTCLLYTSPSPRD